jgi:hypothetical protein
MISVPKTAAASVFIDGDDEFGIEPEENTSASKGTNSITSESDSSPAGGILLSLMVIDLKDK